MSKTIYISVLATFLLVSGLWHVAAPTLTEHWMSNTRVVRAVGAMLLVLALPSLVWRGWYFGALFLALALSGFWRLCFPQSSIRMQQKVYPRRTHGLLLIGGAILVWALRS
jgi:hypothetical protein